MAAALTTDDMYHVGKLLDLIQLVSREFHIEFRLSFVGGDRWQVHVVADDAITENFLAECSLNAAEKIMHTYVKEQALPRARELVADQIEDTFSHRLGYCVHC